MKNVAGLINCDDCVNSHWAIHANEPGLSAIVDVGEVKYRLGTSAKRLEFNFTNCWVEVLL